eukprot:5725075-Pyramimonas_sp.AAC.1
MAPFTPSTAREYPPSPLKIASESDPFSRLICAMEATCDQKCACVRPKGAVRMAHMRKTQRRRTGPRAGIRQIYNVHVEPCRRVSGV